MLSDTFTTSFFANQPTPMCRSAPTTTVCFSISVVMPLDSFAGGCPPVPIIGTGFGAGQIMFATGRIPYVKDLGLENAGVELNEVGAIKVDPYSRTTADNIWAIGDVIPGPMLAHKAEDEGIAVAENIAGLTGIVNHDVIPGVVYTQPEFAGVGLTEEAARLARSSGHVNQASGVSVRMDSAWISSRMRPPSAP